MRQRAHGILLSAQGTPVLELATLFEKTPRMIYTWLDRWEERRFAGLYDASGRGRKQSLDASQREQVSPWIKEYPKTLGRGIALVKETFGILVSKRLSDARQARFSASCIRLRSVGDGCAGSPKEFLIVKGKPPFVLDFGPGCG